MFTYRKWLASLEGKRVHAVYTPAIRQRASSMYFGSRPGWQHYEYERRLGTCLVSHPVQGLTWFAQKHSVTIPRHPALVPTQLPFARNHYQHREGLLRNREIFDSFLDRVPLKSEKLFPMQGHGSFRLKYGTTCQCRTLFTHVRKSIAPMLRSSRNASISLLGSHCLTYSLKVSIRGSGNPVSRQ